MSEEIVPEYEILSYRLEIRNEEGKIIRVETFDKEKGTNVTELGDGTVS